MHDIRGCRCLILIRYDHDNSEVNNISAIGCVNISECNLQVFDAMFIISRKRFDWEDFAAEQNLRCIWNELFLTSQVSFQAFIKQPGCSRSTWHGVLVGNILKMVIVNLFLFCLSLLVDKGQWAVKRRVSFNYASIMHTCGDSIVEQMFFFSLWCVR